MKSNLVIGLLAIVVAAVVGYFAYNAGMDRGRAEGLASVRDFFQDPQRFPTGGQAPGATGANPRQGGGNNPAAAALFGGVQGTVEKIDGNTLTVNVTRGQQTQTVKVNLGDKTTVETFTQGNLSDIKVGSRILVGVDRPQGQQGQGQQGQGQFQIPSEVTARSITVLPTSFTQ